MKAPVMLELQIRQRPYFVLMVGFLRFLHTVLQQGSGIDKDYNFTLHNRQY